MIIFTDGSFIKRKTGQLAGYGIHFPNKEFPDISQNFVLSPLTNQRAELFAIYTAIRMISERWPDYSGEIIIFSDSDYCIKSLTIWIHDWKKKLWKTASGKKVMNLDIIQPIDDLMSKFKGKIIFKHVFSHTGKHDFASVGNSIADKLATDGAQKNISTNK